MKLFGRSRGSINGDIVVGQPMKHILEVLHPRRGATYVNVKCYSAVSFSSFQWNLIKTFQI